MLVIKMALLHAFRSSLSERQTFVRKAEEHPKMGENGFITLIIHEILIGGVIKFFNYGCNVICI